jgi:2-C-methyl-D-erythritol 4-phosphate cytidylyltransferase
MPKALTSLRGRPLLHHTLDAIADSAVADAVVVVIADHARADFDALLRQLPPESRGAKLVAGGSTRQESVRLGLASFEEAADVVLCHDAARPLATPDLFRRVAGGIHGVEGVVPIVPSPDTVKLVEAGRVSRTLPRAQIGLAQTPQAFVLAALLDAHARALREGLEATDDAMLVEAAGYSVATIRGEPQNFKITTPEDLRRAEHLLAERADAVKR